MAKRKTTPATPAPASTRTRSNNNAAEEKKEAAENRKFMTIMALATVALVALLWFLSK
jgi:hypothetical protein